MSEASLPNASCDIMYIGPVEVMVAGKKDRGPPIEATCRGSDSALVQRGGAAAGGMLEAIVIFEGSSGPDPTDGADV